MELRQLNATAFDLQMLQSALSPAPKRHDGDDESDEEDNDGEEQKYSKLSRELFRRWITEVQNEKERDDNEDEVNA